MKFIVCGGRDYQDWMAIFHALDMLHAKRPITLIIEGGALGADRCARVWAFLSKVPYQTCEADWKTHGRAAGPIRNSEMLRLYEPDGVVAFPGGRGTADMIKQAEQHGLKVWRPFG